tara:strand:- start:785 stop:955 length:171 start_codon:yes stop_codon:yes gene_type:complete
MEQGAGISKEEIMEKLVKLQLDVSYIKDHLDFEEDGSLWEKAQDEDNADFFEKNNL